MNINIVAGGPSELLPSLTEFQTELDLWVGVDKGAIKLISMGIQPFMAFGDFDSVDTQEMNLIEDKVGNLKRFKPEKDETDMELALNWAVAQQPELIRLFGATGGRLDHLFANIQLLMRPLLNKEHVQVEIIDQKNIVFLKGPGQYTIEKNNKYKYVSFFPFPMEIKGLTLAGFKYPLIDCHIPLGSTLCISNELVHDYGTFSFTEGILMVVRSID